MTANLQQVVREITTLSTKPSGVLLNGDCAYSRGLPEDYANLAACVAPLDQAGLTLHVTMGNHDDRRPLYAALKTQEPERPMVDSKHVTVIETPHANWFLLDSLTQVNVVTGLERPQRHKRVHGITGQLSTGESFHFRPLASLVYFSARKHPAD